MNKTLYQIIVKGRVQGVGYRYSARNQARFLGLKGMVKNLSDGSVYIEAEGTKNQLDEFIIWCKKGPGFGQVDSVEIVSASLKNYSRFNIEH